jgi:hypothetical protein
MDAYGNKCSLSGRIDEDALDAGKCMPDIDTPLLQSTIPPSIKVPVTHPCWLIDHLDVEKFAYACSNRRKLFAFREVCVTTPLLLSNPVFGLRQAAIFEPSIRVADKDAMNHLFDRSISGICQ